MYVVRSLDLGYNIRWSVGAIWHFLLLRKQMECANAPIKPEKNDKINCIEAINFDLHVIDSFPVWSWLDSEPFAECWPLFAWLELNKANIF